MKLAFVFPGQGSQKIGMGKALADSFPESRKVFEEVDSALNQKLSKIMWDGSESELILTENAQPALMAVSMAALRAIESLGFSLKDQVSYLAGHSLGEYSALAAAGVFSVADAARLLRIRGKAMQEAAPFCGGAMVAVIGLSEEDIHDVFQKLDAPCEIANDNGANQFVLSGLKETLSKAASLCLEKGARRVVNLPVSAPFHSSLMISAAHIMKKALGDIDMASPLLPVISNVSVRPMHDINEVVLRLTEQVTGRVRWREIIEFFTASDITLLCELGSGNVLSGLARRISPSIKTMTIGSPIEVEAFTQVMM